MNDNKPNFEKPIDELTPQEMQQYRKGYCQGYMKAYGDNFGFVELLKMVEKLENWRHQEPNSKLTEPPEL